MEDSGDQTRGIRKARSMDGEGSIPDHVDPIVPDRVDGGESLPGARGGFEGFRGGILAHQHGIEDYLGIESDEGFLGNLGIQGGLGTVRISSRNVPGPAA